MPRCLLVAGAGAGWTGGEIFSNIKAGIVHPLVVELRHPKHFPGYVIDAHVTENASPRQRDWQNSGITKAT